MKNSDSGLIYSYEGTHIKHNYTDMNIQYLENT